MIKNHNPQLALEPSGVVSKRRRRIAFSHFTFIRIAVPEPTKAQKKPLPLPLVHSLLLEVQRREACSCLNPVRHCSWVRSWFLPARRRRRPSVPRLQRTRKARVKGETEKAEQGLRLVTAVGSFLNKRKGKEKRERDRDTGSDEDETDRQESPDIR
jgi:hypothetical protein